MILTDILLSFIIIELAIIAIFVSPMSEVNDPMFDELFNMAKDQIATSKALQEKKKKPIRTRK